MNGIKKTKALVLKKLDYSNTSKIATLFSPTIGKFAAIIKGGRSGKSKIGTIIDTLNEVEIILSVKSSREIQIVRDAVLLNHFRTTKERLDKIKFSSSVLELIDNFIPENDENEKLYRGSIRILELIETEEDNPKLLFVKYVIFFLKEIGYEIDVSRCYSCGKDLGNGLTAYNFENGFMCDNCMADHLISFTFSEELFKLLICLKTKNNKISYTELQIDQLITFFEKYLIYNNTNFKGLKSLKLF